MYYILFVHAKLLWNLKLLNINFFLQTHFLSHILVKVHFYQKNVTNFFTLPQ
jgi:hypothetical protein